MEFSFSGFNFHDQPRTIRCPCLAREALSSIVAGWQNAETLGQQYRFYSVAQREGPKLEL
jgi:hypothetical protein